MKKIERPQQTCSQGHNVIACDDTGNSILYGMDQRPLFENWQHGLPSQVVACQGCDCKHNCSSSPYTRVYDPHYSKCDLGVGETKE